jgi:DNA polymerase I-like protein with 3'-5' exonuclease and polymerase domains
MNEQKQHVCLHTQRAAEYFNIPVEEVTPEHRRFMKLMYFGSDYGFSRFGGIIRSLQSNS